VLIKLLSIRHINLHVDPTDLIDKLKLQIQVLEGIRLERQRLVLLEKELKQYDAVKFDLVQLIRCPIRPNHVIVTSGVWFVYESMVQPLFQGVSIAQ
jgi:hypothetical protein